MLVATRQDFCIQKYDHRWIYNPVLQKVRECSLVDETRVMCSMTAGLEYLLLLSVQSLNLVSGLNHGG